MCQTLSANVQQREWDCEERERANYIFFLKPVPDTSFRCGPPGTTDALFSCCHRKGLRLLECLPPLPVLSDWVLEKLVASPSLLVSVCELR